MIAPNRASQVLRALILLSIVALLAPSPAGARIGNPLKKAKDQIAKKAGATSSDEPDQITNESVVFDEQTLELTGERIDAILAA